MVPLSDLLAEPPRKPDLDSTLSSISKDAPFFYNLGQFICSFAMAEDNIHFLFRHVSGLSGPRSRAIIGGLMIGQIVSIITRLLPQHDKTDEQKEISFLLSHFQRISEFRHNLIHRGGTVSEGGIKSTNIFTAKSLESIEELTFPIIHLKNAIDDIEKLNFRINLLLDPTLVSRFGEDLKKAAFEPWQYKHVQPRSYARKLWMT